MTKESLDINLYMGNYNAIIDWLENEGVTTVEGAKEKLAPIVGKSVRKFFASSTNDIAGSSLVNQNRGLARVIKHFESK